MSHDRGCPCGRERWEYDECMRATCYKRADEDDVKMAPPRKSLNDAEPMPKKNDHPGVWTLVMADMAQRDIEGMKKYNTRLQGFNGRDALVDAYQEALDLAVYLRQAIYERDNK
jgi:hypothetical protein